MSNNRLFENVTLRFWYGGRFKHVVGKGELVYMGGMGRTFQVAPDELCYWELVHFGKKCGDYSDIAGLYFLVPNLSLADGLRKITGDAEVLEMGEIVMKHRSVDVYVLHSTEEPHLSLGNPSPSDSHSSPPISENIPPPIPTKPKKLTPKKGPESQHLGPPRRSPRKHMAIIHAVAAVLPNAEHRHCARHIFALWHKTFRGDEMKLHFWKIAKSYNMADYDQYLEELRELNPDAAIAFTSYNPNLFCRAFLNSDIKTDAITSNMAETFNSYIINARTKHLIYMLEDIRVALMQRLVTKRQEMQKSTSILCPRIQAILEKEKSKAAFCDVLPSSDTMFNVKHFLDQLKVDLEAKQCTCRRWDMLRVPCCHAIACIFFKNKDAESFVDECYKKDVYLRVYGGSIPPCEGERHWPKVPCNLDPPPIKVGPGRPRKNRIKDPYELPKKSGSLSRTGIEMTCSLCKVKGHYKRRCPDKDNYVHQEPAAKRGRGRPRKDGSAGTSSDHQVIDPPYASASSSSVQHHSNTAQPTHLGRGGRVIYSGRGARGAARGGTRGGAANAGPSVRGTRGGRGRGRGRGQVPIGVGVLFSADGAPILQGPSTRNRARDQEPHISTQSSQTSTVHQQQP